MNEENKQKILNWLDKKWPKNRICDICKNNKWTIAEDITTPTILQNNNINIGGKAYPQIMVICNNCGNTKYFNTALILNKKVEN